MGNWTKGSVKLEPIEFDGEQVVFHAKRLLVEDMLVLSKHFNGDKMVFASPMEVCQTAAGILPKYLTAISGYKVDGADMTLEEFLAAAQEFYFVPLVGALFGRLVAISTAKGMEKNLPPPSPASSGE